MRAAYLLPLLISAAPAGAEEFKLDFPVDCRPGETCAIQNFVDRDSGPGWKDYRCGKMSYDGHKGTDIRVPSLAAMRAGVVVKAAAGGRVLSTRDGMEDISIRDPKAPDVSAHECGNGVVIDHNTGWISQYCHMRKGSVAVQPGDRVSSGQRLGLVGLSGMTEFPHLHFQLTFFGRIADPFAPDFTPDTCGLADPQLWRVQMKGDAAYADAFVLNKGFTEASVTGPAVETGELEGKKPSVRSEALYAYVRTIGLQAGDVQELNLTDPDDWSIASVRAAPLDTAKAQFLTFVRALRPSAGWTPGTYHARYAVRRDGRVIRQVSFDLKL